MLKYKPLGESKTNTNPTSEYKISKSKVLFACLLVSVCLLMVSKLGASKEQSIALSSAQSQEIGFFPIIKPTQKYGFVLDTFNNIYKGTIQKNQYLADILLKHKVEYADIDRLATGVRDIFDVRDLRAGKPFTILNKDTTTSAEYFIYEPNPYHYVVYDLKDPSKSEMVKRKINKVLKEASGVIVGSLSQTMDKNGVLQELTSKMEDALAWSVDFHHIQKGDKFKAYYEQDFIDGKLVGIGKLHGAYFQNADQEYYAINFDSGKHYGFFDLTGRSMKKAFLKAPVKYNRISSQFSNRRFHPVLKRYKSHLGTDYAAPKGTPIMTVADGVITKRKSDRNNGNHVKVKHDKTYSTQYLHMSKFKKGVNVGTHVKQGDVIGYVGKTGLATGNHVCYRFWKNGKQVDPRKQNLPPPDPMPEEIIPQYNKVRDSIKLILDKIDFKSFEIEAEKEEVKDEVNTAPKIKSNKQAI